MPTHLAGVASIQLLPGQVTSCLLLYYLYHAYRSIFTVGMHREYKRRMPSVHRGRAGRVLELPGRLGGSTPSSRVDTLIFECTWISNFNPWTKFQTFRHVTPPPSSFRLIPTLAIGLARNSFGVSVHGWIPDRSIQVRLADVGMQSGWVWSQITWSGEHRDQPTAATHGPSSCYAEYRQNAES